MEKFKIGIIGAGIRAIFLMNEILKRDDIEVAAISDINSKSMERLCIRYSIELDRYSDYKELLRRSDIDGVIITSPDYAHEEQAIAAFEAGKHVFLEKPIAITIEGGKNVLRKRDESGKTLLVGFVLRYNELYKKMKEIIGSGIIGEVKTGWVLHSVGSGSDWYFHDWHGTMKNTGGLLLQKGSHDFDIINWIINSKAKNIAAFGSRDLFGGNKPDALTCNKCNEKNKCTEAVSGRYEILRTSDGIEEKVLSNFGRNRCAFRKEIDVLDNHQVIIEYENGVKVSYMECHYTPDDNREYTFIGTKGKLKLDDAANTINVQFRHGMYDRMETLTYSNLQSGEVHGGGDKHILDEFVNALKTGYNPKTGGEEGLEAIKIGIKAHESIRKGEVISLL